ncbi:hypothetical protein MPSEU_000747200 [Mayamaea pseudoterrestris]|nr:hypothetical protein MPSEU_000747200 [Mayamaea pseudoterrestris]
MATFSIFAAALVILLSTCQVISFVFHLPYVTRASSRRQWLSPLSDSSDSTSHETHDTLLRIHLAAQTDDAFDHVQRYVRTFPFSIILPKQPLMSLPTSDGGVELLFLKSNAQACTPSINGGMRLFLRQDDDDDERIVLTMKRNGRDQVCDKFEQEKVVVTQLVSGLTGHDVGLQQGLTKAAQILSIYHMWMLDDLQSDPSTIMYGEV